MIREMWQNYCHWFQAQEDDSRASLSLLTERYGSPADPSSRDVVAAAAYAWWLRLRNRPVASAAWLDWMSERIPEQRYFSRERHETLVLSHLPRPVQERLARAQRAWWDALREKYPDLESAEAPPSIRRVVSRAVRDARRFIRQGLLEEGIQRLTLPPNRLDAGFRQCELGVELADAGHLELGARQIVEGLGWFAPQQPLPDNLASLADCIRRQRGWKEAVRFVRVYQPSVDFGHQTVERLGLWALRDGNVRQALALARACRGHHRTTLLQRIHWSLKPPEPTAGLRMSTLPYLPSERQSRWLAPLVELQLGGKRADRVLAALPQEPGLERLEGLLALAEVVPAHWPEAKRLAASLDDPYAARWALTTAVRLGHESGPPADAESARNLVEALAGQKRFDAALAISQVTEGPMRAQALLALIKGLLAVEEVDRAAALAQQLEPGPSRDEAELQLAGGRLRAGVPLPQVLDDLAEPGQRFCVLLSLTGDGRLESSQVIAEALSLASQIRFIDFFLLADPRLPAPLFEALLPAMLKRGGGFVPAEVGLELAQAGQLDKVRALLQAARQAPPAVPGMLGLAAWLEPARAEEVAATIASLRYDG